MGQVIAFPGVPPPEQPEPPSFEEWQIEVVGDFEGHASDLGDADEEDFYRIVESLIERLQAMRGGPQ
jgi:hypothetical protein